MLNEVAIHKMLNHPNIVKMLDHQTDIIKRRTSLVLEYVNNGTLQDKVNERLLDRSDVRRIFGEVC